MDNPGFQADVDVNNGVRSRVTSQDASPTPSAPPEVDYQLYPRLNVSFRDEITSDPAFSVKNEGSNGIPSDSTTQNGPTSEKVVLKRRVGLISGVALIVGTIIGSGIFVSPGQLLDRTGSVSVGLIIWIACGVLSLLGALAYAELGCVIPRNGGEYIYFYEGMKDLHPFFGPLPGFLFVWMSTLLLKPASMAILSLTVAKYLLRPVWDDLTDACQTSDDFADYEKWATRIVASICAFLITFINCYNVRLAARVQNVFTAAKLAAMAIIIIGGLVKIGEGNHSNLEPDFEETGEAGKLASAFYGGLWAYDGWNQLNYVTEELENPYVTLPRAIIIGLPLCIVLYVLVNVAYLSVMTSQEIISSSAVAVDFGAKVLGKDWAWIMSVAVAISAFGAANGSAFTAGRLTYSAAKEGHMPEVLGYVDNKGFSPSPSLILNGILTVVMIVAGDIGSLIDFFSFASWIFYGGAMVLVVQMRWTKKDVPRSYRVNIAVPVIVALISIYLVVGPIIDDPAVEYLYALGFIAAGIVVYIPVIYYGLALPGRSKLTKLIQILLNVVPTEGDDIPEP